MTRRLVLATSAAVLTAATILVVPVALGSGSGKYTVTAIDFKFKGMPARVAPGTHSFTLVNKGATTHDLKIGPKKTRAVSKGQKATLRITLKKGTYAFLCTVPGHAGLGMKGKLVVR